MVEYYNIYTYTFQATTTTTTSVQALVLVSWTHWNGLSTF